MFRTIGLLAGLIIPCTCLTAQQAPLKDLSLARFENLVEGYGGGGTGTHAQHYFSYTGQKVQSSWSYAKVNASDSFVEWTTGIQIPQISAESSMLMAIAGGIAPDVLEFSQNTLYNYVQQGFLLPLDDMIGQMDPQQMSQRAPLQAWEGGPNRRTRRQAPLLCDSEQLLGQLSEDSQRPGCQARVLARQAAQDVGRVVRNGPGGQFAARRPIWRWLTKRPVAGRFSSAR